MQTQRAPESDITPAAQEESKYAQGDLAGKRAYDHEAAQYEAGEGKQRGAFLGAFLGEGQFRRHIQLGLLKPTKRNLAAGIRGAFAEFIATALFLLFTISSVMTLAGASGLDPSVRTMWAAVFGFTLFVLVCIFGALSGAHINPAVTWAFLIGKRLTLPVAFLYMVAQFGGAIVGTLIARAMNEQAFNLSRGVANIVHTNGMHAFEGEIVGTFLLVLTYLVCSNRFLGSLMQHGPMQLPFAVGMAQFVVALALIPLDNCSVNPARSMGPAVVARVWGSHAGGADLNNQWPFYAGPFLGATIAVLLFEIALRVPEPPLETRSSKEGRRMQPLEQHEPLTPYHQ